MSLNYDLSKDHIINSSAVSQTIEVITVDSILKDASKYRFSLNNLKSTWDMKTKTSFIEAIIVGIPVLYFHFNVSNYLQWEIIDGTQRLITLKEFIKDNAFTFSNDCIVKSLRGSSFKDLSCSHRRLLMEKPVTMHEHVCDDAPLYKELLYKAVGNKKPPF